MVVSADTIFCRGKQATSDSEIDSPAKNKSKSKSGWSSDSEVVSPVKP